MSTQSSPIMETDNPKFKKAVELIKHSDLYDKEYYLDNNQDIKERGIDPLTHYLFYGFKEGRSPSKDFDNEFYLNFYGDVKRAGINPLVHYMIFGIEENRIYNEAQRKQLEKKEQKSYKKVREKLTKKENNLKYLTEENFKKVIKHNHHMDGTWPVYEDAIITVKNIPDTEKVLEINPYKTPLVVQSDILDSNLENKKEYPIQVNNFYQQNLNHLPFPFEDKRYDLVIINNDYENLPTGEEYRLLFDEISRITVKLIIILPYQLTSNNNSTNMVNEEKLDYWLRNKKYSCQKIENDRIIRIYEFM